jgi:hypothetical protein
MIKFPSIEQFRNVTKGVHQRVHFDGFDEEGKAKYKQGVTKPALRFRGTVKLHGTNAAIVHNFNTGERTFQSKERVLTIEEDNAGFMMYMSQRPLIVQALIDNILSTFGYPDAENINPEYPGLAIFGEWCGGNIQKGVGISGLDKMFVIVAIRSNGVWLDLEAAKSIEFPDHRIFNILRFPSWNVVIDFENAHEIQNTLVDLTIAVENECPVAKQLAGVSGIGEGIVWQCVEPGWNSSQFWFKVKGEKHSASKVKVLAAVDVEAVRAITEFVDNTVTTQRLEQGLQNLVSEQLKPFDMTSMGDFIRWVHGDIMKEEMDTIIASGFDVKKLGGPIANKARKWYAERYNAQGV